MKPGGYLGRDLVTTVCSIARRQGSALVQVLLHYTSSATPLPNRQTSTKSHVSCATSFQSGIQDIVRGEIKHQAGRMDSYKCWQILEHCLSHPTVYQRAAPWSSWL